MFLIMNNSMRLKIYSLRRHSQVDHMLDNPPSAIILEWTLCDVMFCVILFWVCSRSLSLRLHLFSFPANRMFVHRPGGCLFVWLQVIERGGPREERDEQRKHNGGLHEEATPKQHRKPERTLRYKTRQVTTWFSL